MIQNYLPKIEGKRFFEGEGTKRKVTNYAVLLTLATIIATYGVISGSTATVIGAMIIAPLMIPIMATTLAMVLGSGHRIKTSIVVVSLSVIYVIGLAVVLSIFISPIVIGFHSNPEITSRVSPNLLALFVALASGAAGAFAISREDISDTLPGVAIAISLVPPLSVVGVSLAKVQWGDAGGALLLFLTNFLAILLAGGRRTLALRCRRSPGNQRTGYPPQTCVPGCYPRNDHRCSPPRFNGYRTLEQDSDTALAQSTIGSWLEGTSYTISRVTLEYRPDDFLVSGPASAIIVVGGTGELPAIDLLAQSLQENLGYPVTIELRVLPEQINSYPRGVSVTAAGQ